MSINPTKTTFLERILTQKRTEVERHTAAMPLDQLRRTIEQAAPARPFAQVLRHAERLGLIAEIKKQSPSKGLLAQDFDPLVLARIYREHGADAISVLTDMEFFGGSLDHLRAIRNDQQRSDEQHGDVPLLRKDFIVDPYQVYESRAYGADAILIIVAAVEPDMVGVLFETTRSIGMDALVEVNNLAELRVALEVGADLIGINNRDLHTFEVDVQTTERVLAALPAGQHPVMVSLSGFSGADGLAHLRAIGADAILVGEAIVTAKDPGRKVRELSGQT
ncbi:MAG: Indole-3-glycerol phosphate synthase [uncultured Chloroflexia bacterium]|uniref:Indole-3-glycerol phosphate synthase n=1 Tax=uncultured Chloroflexia bacterium TaxID=1672391 RepID=A0A6J4IZI5_9CHLR|nr:MAG: Indole-3-glycerol phosphate synthase [uncultured Chloroflexia bacterium]